MCKVHNCRCGSVYNLRWGMVVGWSWEGIVVRGVGKCVPMEDCGIVCGNAGVVVEELLQFRMELRSARVEEGWL